MNKFLKVLRGILVAGLVVGGYRFGFYFGRTTKYYDATINQMAKIQYSLAFREGFRLGSDVACGAYKGYKGPDYDELHPSEE